MDSDYEIRRYDASFKDQIFKLQTHLWSPDPAFNATYFAWKYEQNPYLDDPLVYVALHRGEVVGMRGFHGVQWECGAPVERFTSLYADDLVVAPAHRRRNLTRMIMTTAFADLSRRGHDYVFNLSAGDVTLHSSLSMAWRSAGWTGPMRRPSRRGGSTDRIKALLRPLRHLPVVSRGLARAGDWHRAHTRRMLAQEQAASMARAVPRPPQLSCSDLPDCAGMAALVDRIGADGRIRHVRDETYLRWRYGNPMSRYRFFSWTVERLEGYLVLQEATSPRFDPEILNIVDWEASDPTIRRRLLEGAMAECSHDRTVVAWTATLPPDLVALLAEYGFRHVDSPHDASRAAPAILMRPVLLDQSTGDWQLAGRRLLDQANWDLRLIYSMHG